MGKEKDILKLNNKNLFKIKKIFKKANSKQLYRDDKGEIIEIKIGFDSFVFKEADFSDADFLELKDELAVDDLADVKERRDTKLKEMFQRLGEAED